MHINRRSLLTTAAFSLAGCSIEHLGDIQSSPSNLGIEFKSTRPGASGQRWVYKKFNAFNSAEIDWVQETLVFKNPTIEIQRQSLNTGAELPPEVHEYFGWVTSDPYWDLVQTYEQAIEIYPSSALSKGIHSINTSYQIPPSATRYWINFYIEKIQPEIVHLNGQSFDTVKINKLIRFQHRDLARLDCVRHETVWFCPEIGRWVAKETRGEYRVSAKKSNTAREDATRWELVDWR
ncbi:MAG: hypothetical protein RLY90_1556 [Pseudomonadota bacterium]